MATSKTFTLEHMDVLYIAQQINSDLTALNKAYPETLTMDRAMSLFNSLTIFLANYAVSEIGYSVHDLDDNNLVYLEFQYHVVYDGIGRGSKGGYPIEKTRIPHSAKFTVWVVWSSTMLELSESKQEQIVNGTGWSMPDGVSQRCYPDKRVISF